MQDVPNTSTIQRGQYCPPDQESIRDYARMVCRDLGQENPIFLKREIVSGFNEFLTFIAQTTAKYLNTKHRDYLLRGYKNQRNRCR